MHPEKLKTLSSRALGGQISAVKAKIAMADKLPKEKQNIDLLGEQKAYLERLEDEFKRRNA